MSSRITVGFPADAGLDPRASRTSSAAPELRSTVSADLAEPPAACSPDRVRGSGDLPEGGPPSLHELPVALLAGLLIVTIEGVAVLVGFLVLGGFLGIRGSRSR